VITPRLDTSFTGGQYFDAGNSAEISQTGGVTIWNGSIAAESPDLKWRITLAGDNLGDKLYRVAGTSSLSTASGYAEVINARPRALSLMAQYRFR
jgi:outer membrane receptor protein involved in Fe transport